MIKEERILKQIITATKCLEWNIQMDLPSLHTKLEALAGLCMEKPWLAVTPIRVESHTSKRKNTGVRACLSSLTGQGRFVLFLVK